MRGPSPGLLALILELQSLDRIPRSGYQLRGILDAESVAEHSFHLALIVWLAAPSEPALDRSRAVAIALVHDLAEVRLGDLPRTAGGYLPAGAKHEAERRVMEHLLAAADPEPRERYLEYEAQASPEARFVKACDRLQLLVKTTVYERWGHRGLEEIVARSADLADSEFATIRSLYEEIRALRAEEAAGAPATAQR